jgi:predicted dehydrogenase
MKIGIIGYGKIGKIRHEMCQKLVPNAEYLIYDPELEKSPDPDEIIGWADAVFICTPNFATANYTKKCIAAGKHIFCEKPPALNYDQLLEVEEEYKKANNLVLIYGFNHRQYDSIIKMKQIIDDPETGRVLWMRGRYGKAMGDPNTNGWRADPSKSGGGILLDQGIHMVDLMLYFGGGFDVVQSIVTNTMWKVDGIEDNAFLNMYNTETGVAASLHSTMIEWRHIFSLEVLLERGYLALNGLKTPSGSYGKEVLTIGQDKHRSTDTALSTSIEFKNNNTWEREVRNFLSGIMEQDGRTNLPDALAVMKVIKEAYDGRL